MGKLRAAMRFCTYVHDHIVHDLRHYSLSSTEMNSILKRVYDIDRIVLQLFHLFQQEGSISKDAKKIHKRLKEDIMLVVRGCGFRLDAIKKRKEGWHEQEFSDAIVDFEKGVQSGLKQHSLESLIFKKIDELIGLVGSMLDELSSKHSKMDFNMRAVMGDKARIWKHLLKDMMRRFELEKDMIAQIEAGNKEKGAELKDIERTYHRFYETFRLERFLELPEFKDLSADLQHHLVKKHRLFGKGFDYTPANIRRALKEESKKPRKKRREVKQSMIVGHFREQNVLMDFVRFMHEAKKKI